MHHQIHLQTYVNNCYASLGPPSSQEKSVPTSSLNWPNAQAFCLPLQVPRASLNYPLFKHDLYSFFVLAARLIIRAHMDNPDHQQDEWIKAAEDLLDNAMLVYPEGTLAWSVLGHLRFTNGDLTSASACYQKAMSLLSELPPWQHRLVQLRLASLYLKDGSVSWCPLSCHLLNWKEHFC